MKYGKCSGKCCLEDLIEMRISSDDTYEEDVAKFLEKAKISTECDSNFRIINELNLKTYKDILPYYPRCERFMACSQDSINICLSSRPHWAWEETESLEFLLKDILTVYNRCKRNKIPFDKQAAYDKCKWITHGDSDCANADLIQELITRVDVSGKKATIDGLHKEAINQLYRKRLEAEMIRVGYTPEQAHTWVYDEIKTW